MNRKISTFWAIFIVVIFAFAVAGICICQYLWKRPSEISEALEAIKETPAETKNGKFQWACGSLHTHIMIFEDEKQNNESLKEVIAASKKLDFKFIMMSEKGPAYSPDSPVWKNMIKECDKNNDSDFVCLSGQENCTLEEAPKKPRGHFVIIENKNYIPEILEVPELLNEAHKQESIVIVAHPFYKEDISDMYNYDRWDILDWEAMEVIDGVIDQESNEKAVKKIYELWNKGVKKSLTGGADFKNHKAYTDMLLDPGEVENKLKTGYTCLYLEKLNRENIIDAVRNGHGYASSGPQIDEFSINNAMMGQALSVQKGESPSIKIDVKSGSKIKAVKINNNGEAMKEFNPGAREFETELSISVEKSGWYNLEVYSEDGRAFTNAIWINME